MHREQAAPKRVAPQLHIDQPRPKCKACGEILHSNRASNNPFCGSCQALPLIVTAYHGTLLAGQRLVAADFRGLTGEHFRRATVVERWEKRQNRNI